MERRATRRRLKRNVLSRVAVWVTCCLFWLFVYNLSTVHSHGHVSKQSNNISQLMMMMVNMSGQRSDPANEEGCIRVLSLDEFIHLSLIPAFLIVLVLSLCQRRANAGPNSCCGGRPGLLVPANLLDDTRHRLAYACAFGATATSCLTLFGSYCPPGTPGWLAG
ncbi:stimulated by retinoic acid gene 6 protein-like [Branchiostoma floridae x Branchiostoma japonicum]